MWIRKTFTMGRLLESGEGGYFCHVKARPRPHIVDLSGTECLGWGQVRLEKQKACQIAPQVLESREHCF